MEDEVENYLDQEPNVAQQLFDVEEQRGMPDDWQIKFFGQFKKYGTNYHKEETEDLYELFEEIEAFSEDHLVYDIQVNNCASNSGVYTFAFVFYGDEGR